MIYYFSFGRLIIEFGYDKKVKTYYYRKEDNLIERKEYNNIESIIDDNCWSQSTMAKDMIKSDEYKIWEKYI